MKPSALILFLIVICAATPSFCQAKPADTNEAIAKDDLIQPEDLAKLLKSGGDKPLLLFVGFHALYHGGHIPGAEFIGPVSQPEGEQQLSKRVQSLPRKTFIVIYCGCCPWTHCPNVKPALKHLHSMGFTNAKVLYLPDNFRGNWVDKGYPVESGG